MDTFHVVWKNGTTQLGISDLNLQVEATADSSHASGCRDFG